MKKLLIPILAIVAVSCATFGLGFHAKAGKFLATTEATVDVAMKGYALYVVQNNVPATSQAGVSNAYCLYRSTMLQASNAWAVSNPVAFAEASNNVVNAKQVLVGGIGNITAVPSSKKGTP